ncbi:MAG: VCBS repeat-containing protein, partial [Candidatus Obscuribacterales bacterium]|nr:VCBS repeat-containing protein [Candidatus Obscuribacterales bacterium]
MDIANFHGSFSCSDVTILVNPIVVNEKTLPTLLAQTGPVDYAGMIASEAPMPDAYVDSFKSALHGLKNHIAADVLKVANALIKAKKGDIVVTSTGSITVDETYAPTDIDNDGDTDLIVANDLRANSIYLNDGTGKFKEVGGLVGLAYDPFGNVQGNMGVECADWNNDGWLDVYISTYQRQL